MGVGCPEKIPRKIVEAECPNTWVQKNKNFCLGHILPRGIIGYFWGSSAPGPGRIGVGSYLRKRTQITNTKLGMKSNIYLPRGKKSQRIITLKNLADTANITKLKKHNFLLINCSTQPCNT
jgi:hypothetical protein